MARRREPSQVVRAPDASSYHAPEPGSPPTEQFVPRTPPTYQQADGAASAATGSGPAAVGPGVPATPVALRPSVATLNMGPSTLSGSGIPVLRPGLPSSTYLPIIHVSAPGATEDYRSVYSRVGGGGTLVPPDSTTHGTRRGGDSGSLKVPADSRLAQGVMRPDDSTEGVLGVVKVKIDPKRLRRMGRFAILMIRKFEKRLNDDLHRGGEHLDKEFKVDAEGNLNLVYSDAAGPDKAGQNVDAKDLGPQMKEMARILNDPSSSTTIMLVGNDFKLPPPKPGAHPDAVFVSTALVKGVAYVNIEAIVQYEGYGSDAYKPMTMDPYNLVAGIFQELRQAERIRKGMDYGEADDVTNLDQNKLRKELGVPTFPVRNVGGKEVAYDGGWRDWDNEKQEWVPERDPDAGVDPEFGKMIWANWDAEPGVGGSYRQTIIERPDVGIIHVSTEFRPYGGKK